MADEAKKPERYPAGHSPNWWKNHPDKLAQALLRANTPSKVDTSAPAPKTIWESPVMQIGLPLLLGIIFTLLERLLGIRWLLWPAAGFAILVAAACCSRWISNPARRWRVLISLSVLILAVSLIGFKRLLPVKANADNQRRENANPPVVSSAQPAPAPQVTLPQPKKKPRHVAQKAIAKKQGDCPDGYAMVFDRPIVEGNKQTGATMTGFYIDGVGPCGVKMIQPKTVDVTTGFVIKNSPPKTEPQPEHPHQ